MERLLVRHRLVWIVDDPLASRDHSASPNKLSCTILRGPGAGGGSGDASTSATGRGCEAEGADGADPRGITLNQPRRLSAWPTGFSRI
ncbi:hypothetical protein WME75_31720 [Sorangium sp. So ce1014]|uniref:hypothetical protein n=1 Tax=Sorangium sp. So ce1014 TaxID=3133326 RepID=UPI003F62A7FD